MKKYAIIDDNLVTEILDLEDEEVTKEQAYHSLVVEIEGLNPLPAVGWELNGNTLIRPLNNLTLEQLDDIQQDSQQKFGQKVLTPYVNKLGSRNLKLARESISVNVSAMASQMALLKLLLETGALKTARGLSYQMKSIHTNHIDILDALISEITGFLNTHGWN